MNRLSRRQRLRTLVEKKQECDDAYYNKAHPLVLDWEYDLIVEEIRSLRPDHEELNKVGAPLPENLKDKVKLPLKMGSLNKIRPAEFHDKWIKNLGLKNNDIKFVVTPKLDGISGTLHYRNGVLIAVYTRGEGSEGRNILKYAKHVQGVISYSPYKQEKDKHVFHISGDFFVKGEFIIHKSIFKKYFSKKSEYANERNFCGGMFNRKVPDKMSLRRMTFVAYDYEYTSGLPCHLNKYSSDVFSKLARLDILNHLRFITISNPNRPISKKQKEKLNKLQQKCYNDHSNKEYYEKVEQIYKNHSSIQTRLFNNVESIKIENLLSLIYDYMSNLDILCDGLVIEINDAKLKKKLGYEANGLNPKYARSVKLDPKDQKSKVGVVKTVKWNFTKRGIYSPVVVLRKPLKLSGVNVTNIYISNYVTVKKLGIGKGAKVKVIRSGDVIPRIIGVKKRAKIKAPKKCIYCSTKLKVKTNLYCPNKDCSGIRYMQIHGFFSIIKVDELAKGTIDLLYNNGFKTVKSFIKLKPSDLKGIKGIGDKKGKHLPSAIKARMQNVSLPTLMHASGYFSDETSGLGSTKLTAIVTFIGENNIMKKSYKLNPDVIVANTWGIQEDSAKRFIYGMKEFRKFFNSINKYIRVKKKSGKLKGKYFVFTGFRNNNLAAIIEKNGGNILSSVAKKYSKNTVLFAKDTSSVKAAKARELGIKIIDQSKAEAYVNKRV